MDKIYVVYLNDKPFTNLDGKIYFQDIKKAENYRDNAIRHVGKMLYLKYHKINNYPSYKGWYDMGEINKQEWFQKADEVLSIKTYIMEVIEWEI